MGKITQEMTEICYETAKQIHEKYKWHTVDFLFSKANEIHHKTGMNKNSAVIYMNGFFYMLEGRNIGIGMSKDSIRYYIERIYSDYGNNGLEKALQALQLYYSENIKRLMRERQDIIDEFKNNVCNPKMNNTKHKVILHKKNSESTQKITSLKSDEVYNNNHLKNTDRVLEVLRSDGDRLAQNIENYLNEMRENEE